MGINTIWVNRLSEKVTDNCSSPTLEVIDLDRAVDWVEQQFSSDTS
jgi:hypothetical protein